MKIFPKMQPFGTSRFNEFFSDAGVTHTLTYNWDTVWSVGGMEVLKVMFHPIWGESYHVLHQEGVDYTNKVIDHALPFVKEDFANGVEIKTEALSKEKECLVLFIKDKEPNALSDMGECGYKHHWDPTIHYQKGEKAWWDGEECTMSEGINNTPLTGTQKASIICLEVGRDIPFQKIRMVLKFCKGDVDDAVDWFNRFDWR